MAFNRDKSSLFGGETLLVTFDDASDLVKDTEFYVIFEGQQERHVTSAALASPCSLRAVIPEHRLAETVSLSVVRHVPGSHDRTTLTSVPFAFVEDSAHVIAQHLVSSVNDKDALQPVGGPLRWRDFDLSDENLTTLDNRLMQVFLEMKLPQDWNLLGEDYNLQDIPARESLMHFTARLGLLQLTEFLLYQPGCLDALGLPNREGLVPLDIAQQRQDLKLINILLGKSYYSTGGPPWLEKWKKPKPFTMIQRHDGGLATITNNMTQTKRTLDDDITLLHNMSKVVYEDNPTVPVPPKHSRGGSHSSGHHPPHEPQYGTRQRHSMAEDYHRQKLYYSDKSSGHLQQRHSVAEQSQHSNRLVDISLDSSTGSQQQQRQEEGHRQGLTQQHTPRSGPSQAGTQSVPQPMVQPTARFGQKNSFNKPRYPSPPSRSSESDDGCITKHQQPEPQQYPGTLSSRSGENISPQPPSSHTTSTSSSVTTPPAKRTSPLDRGRERRPLSNQDGMDLEKELWDEHPHSQRIKNSQIEDDSQVENYSNKEPSGSVKMTSPPGSRPSSGFMDPVSNKHTSNKWSGNNFQSAPPPRKQRMLPDVPAWDASDNVNRAVSYQDEIRKAAQEASKMYNNPARTRHLSGQDMQGHKIEQEMKRQTSWDILQKDHRQSDESCLKDVSHEHQSVVAATQAPYKSERVPKFSYMKTDSDSQQQTNSLDRRHRPSPSGPHSGTTPTVVPGGTSMVYTASGSHQLSVESTGKPRPRSAGYATKRTPPDGVSNRGREMLSSSTGMKPPTSSEIGYNRQDKEILPSSTGMKPPIPSDGSNVLSSGIKPSTMRSDSGSSHGRVEVLPSSSGMKPPTPPRPPVKQQLPIHHVRSSSMEGMIGPEPLIEQSPVRGRLKSSDDAHIHINKLVDFDLEDDQVTTKRMEAAENLSSKQKPSQTDVKENMEHGSSQSHDLSHQNQQHRYKRHSSQLTGEHQKKYYQKSLEKYSIATTPSPKESIMQAFLDGLPEPGDYVDVFNSPDGTFVPELHSKGGSTRTQQGVVLEDNLRRLQEIQDGIHKLREINANDKDEHSRRNSLQRHSTSCPSLADQLLQSAKTFPVDNSEHHKSMQDLKRDANQSPPAPSEENMSKIETDIQIYVNDVTVGTSTDYTVEGGGPAHTEDSELLLIEGMKKTQRRSSWCPEEERRKEDKSEKQRLLLGVCGRSQSLSSLEGEDDDSDGESDSSFHLRTIQKPAHLAAAEHIQYMDMEDDEEDDEDEFTHDTGGASSKEASQSPLTRFQGAPKPEILISSPEGRTAATNVPPGEQGGNGSLVVSPSCSIPSPSQSSTLEGEVLEVSGNLPKATSTPSISSNQDLAEADKKRSGSISGSTTEVSPNTFKRSRLSSGEMGHEGAMLQEDQGVVMEGGMPTTDTSAPTFSMIEFLNDSSFNPKNSVDGDQLKGRDEGKDDKKRSKPSMFSKFGSYRQKKVVKENKTTPPSTHQFVSVSFSNSTSCDVCGKSMANKSALQCENCLVNVHEHSCKDHISRCARSRGSTKVGRFQSTSLPAGHQVVRPLPSNLKASQSFKEPSRIIAPPQSNLHTAQSAVLHNNKSTAAASSSSSPPCLTSHGTGYFQWRRVATKLGIENCHSLSGLLPVFPPDLRNQNSKVDERDDLSGSQLLAETSNITDVLSVSMESIEEEHTELEVDPDLFVTVTEPEAWSVTVDKKTLKKMSAKDIKRQDHIWEFVQTEKSHCRTLRIMHKIFYSGLIKECELSQEMVDRIFPCLFELLDIHLMFLNKLLKRQAQNNDKSIDVIGDLLYEQFSGVLGEQMKDAYGDFCSRHHEAVQLYKDIMKDNKKVQVFAKKCSNNVHCKRLDIPACILLVTQRTSKYPLLVESIIKATKDFKEERDNLMLSLSAIRDILAVIDRRIDEHEKYLKLIEIYNKIDARSYASFKGSKFKKSDLLSNGRKLLHEGYIKWMSARGKPCEVLAVILSDVMFFLAESNGKLSFFSQDNKSSVISLSKLIVREKGDTKDSKGIYLICRSKTQPEMYELVCRSADERKFWIPVVKEATAHCFEEEAGAQRNEEDRKLLEARSTRLRQLIDQLRQRDQFIRSQCEEKMKVFGDIVELFGKEDGSDRQERAPLPYKDQEGHEWPDPDTLLQAAIQQGEKLMALLQSSTASVGSNASSINLSRSVSSVGEHSTGNTTPPLPKRAETFNGFENKENGRASVKKRFPTVHAGAKLDIQPQTSSNQPEAADSGLGLDVTSKSSPQRRISVAVPYAIQEANNRVLAKEKANPRRMSTSFLQHLLTKQHNDREETESNKSSSDKSSDRGSTLDLAALSPAQSISNLALSKEQCQTVSQLMHYVHGLACMASQQHSELESFKAQLAEANAKITQLYSESDRFTGHPEKKSKYHHDKQLEELRNLQEHINQDRSQFEKIRMQQNLEIHQEKQDIKKDSQELDKQRSDLKAQRDELQRQKEALQKQVDMFEEQKALFQKTVAATELAQQATKNSATGLSSRERSESPIVEHRRTGSADFNQRHSRESSPFDGGSLKEPLNKVKNRSNSGGLGLAGSGGGSGSKSQLPYHLSSATNEQKVTQKLPLKLASGKSNPSSSHSGTSSSSGGKNTQVKQVLPFKLSGGSSTQTSNSPNHHHHQNSQLMRSSSPGGGGGQSHSGGKPHLQHTRSQPTLSGLKKTSLSSAAHTSGSNILPMKLAEKLSTTNSSQQQSQQRPKSLSSLTKTNQNLSTLANDANNAKSDDKKVIYF